MVETDSLMCTHTYTYHAHALDLCCQIRHQGSGLTTKMIVRWGLSPTYSCCLGKSSVYKMEVSDQSVFFKWRPIWGSLNVLGSSVLSVSSASGLHLWVASRGPSAYCLSSCVVQSDPCWWPCGPVTACLQPLAAGSQACADLFGVLRFGECWLVLSIHYCFLIFTPYWTTRPTSICVYVSTDRILG